LILLTGAGGGIGAGALRLFRAQGLDVLPVFHAASFKKENDGFALDLSDMGQVTQLADALPSSLDTVMHLAGVKMISLTTDPRGAQRPPIPGAQDVPAIYRSNVLATANLLKLCSLRKLKRLIFASSQTVYGLPAQEDLTEDTPRAPLEYYAASKVACEDMLRLATGQGLAVTCLRFPGIYGDTPSSGTVWKFCEDALKRQEVVMDAAIALPFDVLHLDDLLGLLRSARFPASGWNCLNLSTGERCSLELLAREIAGLVSGCKLRITGVQQPVIRMVNTKARDVLGWSAKPRHERLAGLLHQIQHA